MGAKNEYENFMKVKVMWVGWLGAVMRGII